MIAVIALLIVGGAMLPERHKFKLPMILFGLFLIIMTAKQ